MTESNFIKNLGAGVAASGTRILPHAAGETFSVPVRIALATVTGGSVALGWTVAITSTRDGSASAANMKMGGDGPDAHLFTWPRGETLTVGQVVQVLFLSGQVAVILLRGRSINSVSTAGICSGGMMGYTRKAVSSQDVPAFSSYLTGYRLAGIVPGSFYNNTVNGNSHAGEIDTVFSFLFAGVPNEDLAPYAPGVQEYPEGWENPWFPDGHIADMFFGVPWPSTLADQPFINPYETGNAITWNRGAGTFNVVGANPVLGQSILMWCLWNPTVRCRDENPDGSKQRPLGRYVTIEGATEHHPMSFRHTDPTAGQYTMAQWPYGTDAPLWVPDAPANGKQATMAPCWIFSNRVDPMPDGVDTPACIFDTLEAVGFFPRNGADGPTLTHACLFWFMPDSGTHLDHHIARDWHSLTMDDVAANEVFFMGKPQFFNPAKLGAGRQDNWIWYEAGETDPADGYQEYKGMALGSWFYNEEMETWSAELPTGEDALAFAYPTRCYPGMMEAILYHVDAPYAWTQHADTNQTSDCMYAPHIGVDAEFRLPFIEFARPAIPPGCTVESATAEIYVTEPNRVEYSAKAIWSGAANFEATSRLDLSSWKDALDIAALYDGDVVGWEIHQKSNATPASWEDAAETNVLVQKVYFEMTTSGGFSEHNYQSSNTHVNYWDFWQDVETSTGTAPKMAWEMDPPEGDFTRRPPMFIPKLQPWFSTPQANAPETAVALTGLRLNFAAIGMQPHNEVIGGAVRTNPERTRKEMARTTIWHHPDNVFDDTVQIPPLVPNIDDYTPSVDWPGPTDAEEAGLYFYAHFPPHGQNRALHDFFAAETEEAYLAWLRAQDEVPDTVGDLLDYRYRWVASCAPTVEAGRDTRIKPDVWETINLDDVFQAIVDDVARAAVDEYDRAFTFRHTRYRIMPCGPREIITFDSGASTADPAAHSFWRQTQGEWTNAGPLWGTMLPEIRVPESTAGSLSVNCSSVGQWQTRLNDIIYQNFASFQMRNLVVVLRTSGGRRITWRIATPWD